MDAGTDPAAGHWTNRRKEEGDVIVALDGRVLVEPLSDPEGEDAVDPDRSIRAEFPGPRPPRPGGGRFDLRLHTLGPELGAYFGADAGALILDVGENSSVDLRPGDLVLGVGDRTVEDAADLRRILASYEEREEVRARLRRDGSEEIVTGIVP